MTSLQVAYDPRRLDHIYIPDISGKGYTKCFPVANSKKFGSMSYDDYVMLQKYLKEEKASLKASKTQREIDTDGEIQKIVRQAKKRAENYEKGDMSKTEKLRNIRSNRAVERELRHDKEGFELGILDLLKRKGDEKLGGEK